MATTIHLAPDLLKSLDEHATELGISRNRYIIQAVERAIEDSTQWSSRFRRALAAASEDRESHEALTEMVQEISVHRSSKGPPEL